jgi:hypothetical protein
MAFRVRAVPLQVRPDGRQSEQWRSGKAGTVAADTIRTPNLALRRIRETERRESRDEFAAAVVAVGRQLGDKHLACDARLIARWEDGEVGCPRPVYQRALEALTGRPFEQLGFRVASAIDGPMREALQRSVAPVDEERHAPNQERRAPTRLGHRLTSEVLDLAGAAANEELIARLTTARSVSVSEVAIMRQQLENIRQLDRKLGAPAVLEQLRALITTMTELLTHSLRPGIREPLAALVADAGALAGWQALDVGAVGQAWRYYETAKSAAREARSDALLAHAMGEQSFALLDMREAGQAAELVGRARMLTVRRGPALLTAWLHAAEAEAHAAGRDYRQCLRALDLADGALPAETSDPALPFIFLSDAHLARWRGNCLVRLGDATAVEHSLAALATMDSSFTRAAAGLWCDLAEAMLILGELDEATVHAQRATELALRVGSVRQRRRIGRLAARTESARAELR